VAEGGQSEVTVYCQGISLHVTSPTLVRILDEEVVELESAAFYRVRVLEGEQTWARVLANEKNLTRSDRQEPVKSPVQPDDSQTTVPIASEPTAWVPISREPTAPRASTLHKIASNLEDMGNTQGAIDFYRQVVIKYPDSIPAASARKRIKSLRGKIPSPAEYKPLIHINISSSIPPEIRVRKRESIMQDHDYQASTYYFQGDYYGSASVYVNGYNRHDGTYVHSYSRSYPHASGSYKGMGAYAHGPVHVNGYIHHDGTYVHSYSRSYPRR
jgi:hypothetical protein